MSAPSKPGYDFRDLPCDLLIANTLLSGCLIMGGIVHGVRETRLREASNRNPPTLEAKVHTATGRSAQKTDHGRTETGSPNYALWTGIATYIIGSAVLFRADRYVNRKNF